MADNEHTLKNASGSRRKSGDAGRAASRKGKRETAASRAARQGTAGEASGIPARVLGAIVFISLFVLLVVVLLEPDGVLPWAVLSFVTGTIGWAGFYMAIPATFFLFTLLAFGGKRPVRMRCACVLGFVFLFGCISHIVMNPQELPQDWTLLSALWRGGIAGTSGGVLCGGMGMLLRWLLGSVISYVVLIPAVVLLLLASFRVTLPGMIRAVRNRPRLEREEEEEEDEDWEDSDPSAAMVNCLAQLRIDWIRRRRTKRELAAATEVLGEAMEAPLDPKVPEIAELPVVSVPVAEMPAQPAPLEAEPVAELPKKVTGEEARAAAADVAREVAQGAASDRVDYCYPPLSLLHKPEHSTADGTEEMRENSRRLDETLESFKIDAHIVNVTRGPSVTRYEVELEKGVRLSKLTSCADDIALSLGASGVRIAAVPGKISVVGIEVPNRIVTTVSLREVLDSREFNRQKSQSSFAVGKDIGGSCIVGNISKLPHMLIAGTTGSGKSVCMNSIIISLLYKASPQDVKLIMVDPKMVELGIYNGIPHLLIPVVTDPKKAAGALQWAVTEMLRRYRAMSDAGVRDLESYNSIVDSQETEGEHLPQIVVIIDELADLMLVAAKEVEEAVQRIAQMGRAAGIHLIIATQRPSADVITGVMKANIPSRIAFSVASAMESRIILDTQGAEKLVGKGDMLYAPTGCGKPKRVQGCFVTDGEVESVATYIKEHYTTSYDQEVMEEIERKAEQTGTKSSGGGDAAPTDEEMAHDEMLPAAVDVLLETGQASVSMLQRRLKLGYARAARIVDEMEEMGIVGPFQGSKPRTILITREQWQAMQDGSAQQLSFPDLPENPEASEDDEDLPF